MTTPTWGPTSGPPPSRTAKAKSVKPKPQPLPPPTWAAPSTPPISLAPPVVKIPYEGVAVVSSKYTCLAKESDAALTSCGRLAFLAAISVTGVPEEVTCPFCRMRLRDKGVIN